MATTPRQRPGRTAASTSASRPGSRPTRAVGATIYSVAERAGVSIATVSRVLQGSSVVSEATRQKVLEAAEALHYVPVGAARSLAVRHHEAYGLVIPELTGPYYSELLMGFETRAAELGQSVILLLANGKGDLPRAVGHLATRVDGIAVLGAAALSPTLARALRGRKPVVIIAGAPSAPRGGRGVELVAAENVHSAEQLTTHVLDHGRSRLLFVGDPDQAPDTRERYAGFVAAHTARGLVAAEPVRVPFREADGVAVAGRILAGELDADALVCANDELALSIMSRLQDAGRRRAPRHRHRRLGRRHDLALRPSRPHHRAPAGARARGARCRTTPPAGGRRSSPPGTCRAANRCRAAPLVRLPRPGARHGGRPLPHLPDLRSPPSSREPLVTPQKVRHPMRRTTITVACMTAAALTMTACGRSEDNAGSAGQTGAAVSTGAAKGNLTMWAMGAEGDKLPELIKDFETANPGVKVKVTAIPWNAAHDKFMTAVTANKTPDLAMVGTTWMGELAGSKALDPTPSQIDNSAFFEGAQKTTEVDGTSYGIPWYVETRVVFYRSDLAKKAGFDTAPDRPGRAQGHGQGHADQGWRQVGHRPAGRRRGLLAVAHAVRLVERRRPHEGRRQGLQLR